MERMARAWPNATRRELADVGHYVMEEAYAEVLEELENFWPIEISIPSFLREGLTLLMTTLIRSVQISRSQTLLHNSSERYDELSQCVPGSSQRQKSPRLLGQETIVGDISIQHLIEIDFVRSPTNQFLDLDAERGMQQFRRGCRIATESKPPQLHTDWDRRSSFFERFLEVRRQLDFHGQGHLESTPSFSKTKPFQTSKISASKCFPASRSMISMACSGRMALR